MASDLVVHAEVGKTSYSEVLTGNHLRIGLGDDCDLRLRYDSIAEAEAMHETFLELARSNGDYHVKDFDRSLSITHNGVPISSGDVIRDGDEVRAPAAGVTLSFFPVTSHALTLFAPGKTAHVAPFIEHAALEAEATVRRDDAKMFLREFTRELVRETSPITKGLVLLIILALLSGGIYLGYAAYRERQQNRTLLSQQGEKLGGHEQLLDEQGRQIDEVKRQVDKTAKQLSALDQTDQIIVGSLELAPALWSSYHRGVCLISGTYIFVEPGTERPLRYRESLLNEEGEPLMNRDDLEYLTAEGDGPIAEFGYAGTGFHVGQGYILTNKHVAGGPWESDARVQLLRGMTGGQPRLKKLVAFFPGRRQPIALKFERASGRDDLAVCTLSPKGGFTNLPALPLAEDSDAVKVGERILTMGYPSGPERILALLSDEESMGIQKRHGQSVESLVRELAARNMVRPLTTQGNVTDLSRDRIVNDAMTGDGGSGAPVFGQRGRVVGITFAVFIESNASNFAIPIGEAIQLLKRSGWTMDN